MIFVIVWFLYHCTLEYVSSMNSIWIIPPAGLIHVWVTKFNTSLIFFKQSILASNNVILVHLFAILFDEAQHIVKIYTTGYVLVFYEVINLFIKLQIFCWFSSFLNSRAFIWLSRSVMARWCFPGSLQFLHQIHAVRCLSGCTLWALYPCLF